MLDAGYIEKIFSLFHPASLPTSPEGEADPPALRCKALRAGGGRQRPASSITW